MSNNIRLSSVVLVWKNLLNNFTFRNVYIHNNCVKVSKIMVYKFQLNLKLFFFGYLI